MVTHDAHAAQQARTVIQLDKGELQAPERVA
jgi:ABC-type lipoprotein export system ATPase subunit